MSDNEPDDITLLQRSSAGDSDALLALHKRYANLVYSMAWRVLNDVGLAEDVTQDVFVKIWQGGRRYDPALGRFSTWILTVTRFAAIDRLRRERRQPRPLEPFSQDGGEPAALEDMPGDDHAVWERGRHLHLLVEQLPAEQRQVLELAYFGGLTHSELAAHLDLPLGTVKGRLRLALEKLRVWWQEDPGSGR